jgi:demethylmenaquinone methyltransferase/2-methoxy-6-polyprenyl-1,4-benzoquinol methylase
VAARAGERILDLAAGTGTSTAALRDDGVTLVAADFSPGMLDEGRRRYPDIEFVFADAIRTPFVAGEFDAATMSFGLRNVSDFRACLREMHRIVKPSGRLVICEFSQPRGWLAPLYRFHLRRVMPLLSRMLSPNPEAYDYLAESIAAWPSPDQLAAEMRAAGFRAVRYRLLAGGIVAIHSAQRTSEVISE